MGSHKSALTTPSVLTGGMVEEVNETKENKHESDKRSLRALQGEVERLANLRNRVMNACRGRPGD